MQSQLKTDEIQSEPKKDNIQSQVKTRDTIQSQSQENTQPKTGDSIIGQKIQSLISIKGQFVVKRVYSRITTI